MASKQSVDIQKLYNREYTQLMFKGWGGGCSRATNLDGLIAFAPPPHGTHGLRAYTQLYRSGVLELFRSAAAEREEAGRRIMPSGPISRFFRDAILKCLELARAFRVSGPAIVGAAVVSVDDYEFGLSLEQHSGVRRADREHLVFPETWINDIESVSDADEVVRPLLDMLWQSFDVECCPLYDDHGRWQPT